MCGGGICRYNTFCTEIDLKNPRFVPFWAIKYIDARYTKNKTLWSKGKFHMTMLCYFQRYSIMTDLLSFILNNIISILTIFTKEEDLRRATPSYCVFWGCSPSQNVLKSDMKKSKICPIWGKSDPTCVHPWPGWSGSKWRHVRCCSTVSLTHWCLTTDVSPVSRDVCGECT